MRGALLHQLAVDLAARLARLLPSLDASGGLYAGRIGICRALIHADVVLGTRHARLVHDVLASCGSFERHDLGEGDAGLAFVSAELAAAGFAAPALPDPGAIQLDAMGSDYLHGVAGVGLVALQIANLRGEGPGGAWTDLAERARACLHARVQLGSHGLHWERSAFATCAPLGFAHGTAGIAYFLAACDGSAGGDELDLFVRGALAHDRAHRLGRGWADVRIADDDISMARYGRAFDEGTWPCALARDTTPSDGFCNGSVGFGILRLALCARDTEAAAELTDALAHIAQQPLHEATGLADFAPCHGWAGALELWLAQGETHHVTGLRLALERVLAASSGLAIDAGKAGLFDGAAGALFAALRLLAPGRTPNVFPGVDLSGPRPGLPPLARASIATALARATQPKLLARLRAGASRELLASATASAASVRLLIERVDRLGIIFLLRWALAAARSASLPLRPLYPVRWPRFADDAGPSLLVGDRWRAVTVPPAQAALLEAFAGGRTAMEAARRAFGPGAAWTAALDATVRSFLRSGLLAPFPFDPFPESPPS